MGEPKGSSGGFTLIELVIVIIVLGIVAAVGIPKIGRLLESSRLNATKAEMHELKLAIVGNPQLVAGGTFVNCGFLGDVGFAPQRLADLVNRPDSIPAFDKIIGIGWNGPYIDTADGESFKDAWGVDYVFDPVGRTIASTGSGTDITVSF